MVNKANVVAQFVACKIITVLLKSVLYTFFLAGDDHLVYRPALPFIVCTCTLITAYSSCWKVGLVYL